MPRTSYACAAVALAGAAALIAACGSGGSAGVVRSGGPPLSSTTATSGAASTSGPASTPSGGRRHPSVVVEPARGLSDRQTVRVRGSGFTPGEVLQVIECAAKQAQTGPGDCNLLGMLTATADANGAVVAELAVLRGPFGANGIVCSARQPCLISVTQASLQPTEEADTPIAFGPPSRSPS